MNILSKMIDEMQGILAQPIDNSVNTIKIGFMRRKERLQKQTHYIKVCMRALMSQCLLKVESALSSSFLFYRHNFYISAIFLFYNYINFVIKYLTDRTINVENTLS